ncbi:hypothetical protein AMATHDRAFT_68861 [Amanita thiersii Skay4041]|uniref:Dihydrolipoamide acetyltransferase component of pyruvate dehydrogenase complex n=1 Tax=Amanita thiersii Skay4041 TaxID=703135 RepID=A0A2A9NGP6_9AGAR|nr:hypothetical protein AMATHDRAFT_68861 [Amanita thiersii Skay4041]
MFIARRLLLGRPLLRSCFHTTSSAWATRKVIHKFKLADIGEGITECEVIKWSVGPKSTVQSFDPLCEVQSDKASVEITSPFDGVIKELLVNEGQVAKVGEGLCLIEVEEEAGASDSGAVASTEATDAAPAQSEMTITSPSEQQQVKHEPQEQAPVQPKRLHPLDPNYVPQATPSVSGRTTTDVLAAPSVRHFAKKNGVDLALVAPGSGKGGRIEKKDVEAYMARGTAGAAAQQESAQQVLSPTEDVVVELGRTRYGMWKAMTKSLEIPHFGYSTSLDLTAIHNLLPILNAGIPQHYLPASSTALTSRPPLVDPSAFHPAPQPQIIPDPARFTKLTYLPILLKTLSKAMNQWPIFRSSITPGSASSGGKPTMTLRPHSDISLALSTPTGLYTPTLTSVDTHSVYGLASRIAHLAYLGRQVPCGLTPKDMPKRGGTISVSNIGAVGKGEGAMPVLVEGGGVAIVAIGRAKWVWDVEYDGSAGRVYAMGGKGEGRGRGEERLKVNVSWAADHRVVEGAEMAAFVENWREWVEVPERFIAEGI